MINFIIVEDDKKYVDSIRRILDKLKYKISDEVKTYEFSGYNNELKNLINKNDERKIYILDIELENSKSGIEIASMIRETDWDSEIIFITNHDKMFETAHRNIYEVFDFIEKYHELEKRLTNDIKKILNRNMDKKMFKYNGRNINLQLYLHSIKYIYRDKGERKTIIVTESSTFSVNIGLKETFEMLDDRFRIVHRSCIVNTDYVELYDWNKSYIILKDGTKINYLSKKYRKGIKNENS